MLVRERTARRGGRRTEDPPGRAQPTLERNQVHAGGGRIEVRAAPRDHAVEISVTDTGVAIGTEDKEAVFEEFR